MKRYRHIAYFLLTLLLFSGTATEVWAVKVTYHVLTLPIDASTAHMVDAVDGKRLEAIRVIVDNAATIELPAHFKSPLATNFMYYAADQVEASAATFLYSGSSRVKEIIYNLVTTPSETPEGASVTSDCDIYVTYTYNSSNTIAKLDGSKVYCIGATYGFLAFNRGRSNRPAVVPRAKVTEECLTSDDFTYIDSPGSGISTYWVSGDNKNPRASIESQFYFQFKLEGSDPYNIIIRTAYSKDSTYMEKEANNTLHFKYYKKSSIFTPGNNNAYLASDEHIAYNKVYTNATDYPTYASFPTTLTEGDGTGWTSSPGFYHGTNAPVWSSFALLNNTTGTGYVFMGSRTYNNNGTFNAPSGSNNNYNYNYLKLDNNNLTINRVSPADATKKYSVDAKFYEIKTVRFNVKTPFGNTVSDSVKMSEYKILNDDILMSDIPTSLARKYCTFTKFYKDAALTQEITKYSEMTGTDIYVGYQVQNTPFQAITKADTYSDATWKAATWYELTDESSTEASGKKLKYDGTNYFKNNGASGEHAKTSEFAFIGDPYELRVVYRDATSGASPKYVGATGTPSSPTNLTISETETAGYKWEIPDDDISNGSFLLQQYGGTGHWNWTAGNRSEDMTYNGEAQSVATPLTSNAQTVTFNISGLTVADGNYIKVTKGGTDAAQVTATIPTLSTGIGSVDANGKATVTATIAANTSGANKTFTLTVTEYDSSDAVVGSATTITVTQGTTAFTGNTVEYSTSSSTRIKVLELPKKTFTYKIVDKSGRIAVTASASQTIFSPLSLASIPSIIISPFILDETITFYSTFKDGDIPGTSRAHLSTVITETPNANAPIYVKYTTTNLNSMPFKLSEDQEIFVRLNGEYIYYDAGTFKSSAASGAGDGYKWKLRNQDPYAMLIDNMGAREVLPDVENKVAGQSETVTVYNDAGVGRSESRQMGAWVDVATIENAGALSFTTTRADAQRFIAKSSARAGVYEVMVATGDGVDASTTYYNIGRLDQNTVKIYSNATYQAGDDNEIKFRLEENVTYTYHLIDKAKHELLTVESKSPELVLPAEYQSPLVGAANYSYYAPNNITISGTTYTPTDPATKLSSLSGLDATYTKTKDASYSSNWTNADPTHKLEASSETDLDDQAKKLEATGDYYYKVGSDYWHVNVTKPRYLDIYVTYVKNSLVTFNSSGHPYMLKFLDPAIPEYYLEDGNDKLTETPIQPIYPYCNGDGNLNIYGAAMNEEQMNGGANTRPRWIWYFDNPGGSTGDYADDPYHVTIHSRSDIKYNNISHYTYLQTYAVKFKQDSDSDPKHIVTGGCLPTIADDAPTEYMILGTEGNYRLLTTNLIEGERRSVTSLEQYWKTYNMVKQEVLEIDVKNDATYKDAFSEEASTFVIPDELRDDLVTKLTARGIGDNWHSYEVYANATRWNGYNNVSSGHEKKVVEKLEHWFQTFDMGNGAFDIESADIPPVLVLLDRHGWEIMRKPLPTTTYPYGDELDDLRVYDSPMVKEYHFFNNATKASGCHKYSLRIQNNALRDEIKVGGKAYTSTSLATLPPITASGVKDTYGFIQDFYVTYTVKEEYEKSYTYTLNADSTDEGTASKFLVLQNGRFMKKENDNKNPYYISKPIWEHTNPEGGNAYDLILSPKNNTVTIMDGDKIADYNFWYIGPNLDIDREMGIKWGTATSGSEPLTEKATKALYANTSKVDYMQTTGFDPYNLQIKNVDDGRFVTTHMTSATLVGGAMVGSYNSETDANTTNITLATGFDLSDVNPETSTGTEGYDHTNIKITNQTFMAVQDVNGNMQLMPRFDHTLRVNTEKSSPYLTTLQEPKTNAQTATVDDNNSMNAQTTFLVRPQVMEYLIIDNQGREALRYKRAGEFYPAITEHFKSPLATNFKFYKTLPDANSDGVYELDNIADTITGSFAAAGLDDDNETVYVRYNYNENYDLDGEQILQGKWFTIKLNNLDVWASGTIVTTDNNETPAIDEKGTGVSLYAAATSPASPTKPATIDEDDKTWQWKFLVAPTDPSSDYYVEPDPYAIELYNRSANYATTLAEPSPMSVPIKVNGCNRFSLLSHPDGGYALAVDGLGTYTYSFLNGASMTTSVAATTTAESTDNDAANHFTIKSNALSAGAQFLINDDVTHNYRYNVINNAGTLAASDTQDDEGAAVHSYAPYLPEAVQTPMLNDETDYLYYGSADKDDKKTLDESDDTYTEVDATKLFTLYGLYDDVVYVRYKAYDAATTPYLVPNEKAIVSSKVARGSNSNDVAMNISGGLPYNIIWENDNMMKSTDNAAISDGGSQSLSGTQQYVWYFTGDDPYALKIKHKGGSYVNGTTNMVEEASAKQFMLLKKEGYDYGILAETGNQNTKLSGYGGETTTGEPTKFIIFGLSVHDLIYHLIIAKSCPDHTNPQSGEYVDIPYMESESGTPTAKRIFGTTQRDLTSTTTVTGDTYQLGTTLTWGGASHTYSYDAGTVSIGDVLEVPSVFYRPNCTFDFYIEGVYSNDKATTETALNKKFKGLKLDNLMTDADLIDKTVVVNIVYQFDKSVATNTGLGFVTSTNQNLWYTLETLNDGTPHLARYTNTQGLKTIAGRETRYTNDYLFTPVGDVYGFKMFNRYFLKNSNTSGDDNTKMMTTATLTANASVVIDTPANGYEIYELTAGDTPGYFRIHPVANTDATKYYVNMVGSNLQLGTTPSEWTWGLDMSMLQPYYQAAGYVGGLNDAGKTAYKDEIDKGDGNYKITDLQAIVYNDANIVNFADGYYRLHSQPGIQGISPVRYASGYLHDIEKTAGTSSTAIPMHFYSKVGVSTTFEGEDGLSSGFTKTVATQGDIPVPATEDDPSTIFHVVGGDAITNRTISNVTLSTQGLNVIENKMGTGTATTYRMIDIGGGVVVLVEPVSGYYFNFTQTGNIYDLKYSAASTERLDDVKWCMEPANNQGLEVTMNDGGDDHYYATFCAPFDVTITNGEAEAYVYNEEWNTTNIHPTSIGKTINAGTPVIIRSTVSGDVTMTLPGTASSASSCIFTGKYLEQMLAPDASHDVYTFGLPFTSTVTSFNREDGSITAPASAKATTGVGFYINANPNKEADPSESLWLRNNRYVLHNKIYYREGSSGASSREKTRGVEFVPVIFDDEGGEDPDIKDSSDRIVGDGCVYDLQGRKVATKQQVEDDTWSQFLRPGIYIINGKKIRL